MKRTSPPSTPDLTPDGTASGASDPAPGLHSPRAFLESRRPERFSDSTFTDERTLDRQLLDYHLETLTSRGQETDFERFARRLAEREVCPNLLPQTGPTGGGDSKVDSETFPVAESLALAWLVGLNAGAAHERWAFAFSAKKDWRPKVRSDIAKIAGTARGYSKAFFVTNQFVPDRVRAQVEDALRGAHGVDVRILDRTWILDRVFTGGHEDLVEEELGLRARESRISRLGPRDAEREAEINATDERITEAVREGQFTGALVDDALYAAELGRALDRPRREVDGRFERADRLALEHGTLRQKVEVAYQAAWTAYWWHEDEVALVARYGVAEERVCGSRNAYDLERLVNLWYLLYGATRLGRVSAEEARLDERRAMLVAELERLSEEVNRPSTSLQARVFLTHLRLAQATAEGDALGPALVELRAIVEEARGLTGFPLDPVVQNVVQLGEIAGESPEYDALFESVARIASDESEGLTLARLLLKRGRQHLRAGRATEAIRILGRSLSRLYNHEGRHEAVIALYLCGAAYEQIGLMWAARGSLVAAASLATDELWRYGDVTRLQAACYGRLKWIELQLGRLPHILAWHANESAVRGALGERGEDAEAAQGSGVFDASFGVLLLRTKPFELGRLTRLPDALERLGLPWASMALLFALGHDDEAWQGQPADEQEAVFLALSNQPVGASLPSVPELCNGRRVTLRSRVLGCEYFIEADNQEPCVEIAESILASLESFLGSVPLDQAFASVPDMHVRVRTSDVAGRPFAFEITEKHGRPHLDVSTQTYSPHDLSRGEQGPLRQEMLKLVATLMAHSVRFADYESTLGRLVEREEVFDRAFAFTSSFVTLGNVLGHTPPVHLSAWEDGRTYNVLRIRPWDDHVDRAGESAKGKTSRTPPVPGEGDPPSELLAVEDINQKEIRMVSLIRDGLWTRAGWMGIGFVQDTYGEDPPVLVPLFRDGDAGREIFRHWRDELGHRDEADSLRILVVRGVDRKHPHHYRVVFTSNTDALAEKDDVRFLAAAARIHLMEPDSSVNLDRFLSEYAAHKRFLVMPGVTDKSHSFRGLDPRLVLEKRSIVVRNAWEIGRHDMDGVAIQESDDPFIPEGNSSPPVHKLLEWKRRDVAGPKESERKTGKGGRNSSCPCGSGRKFKQCHGRAG